jgi:hypothetical protein
LFQGRTIRVQYRELHQKIYPSPPSRNPTTTIPKLAAPSTTRPQQLSSTPLHRLRKIPQTLGQLSGTGGLPNEAAVNGFGGFDPITGLANGVVPPLPLPPPTYVVNVLMSLVWEY